MSLSIYKLDGAPGEDAVCVLSKGEHPIGRGPLLQCKDKSASTRHALIKVGSESSSITSTHRSPCFHQSSDSQTVTILPVNSPVDIQTEKNTMPQNLKRLSEPSADAIEKKQAKLAEGRHDDDVGEAVESVDDARQNVGAVQVNSVVEGAENHVVDDSGKRNDESEGVDGASFCERVSVVDDVRDGASVASDGQHENVQNELENRVGDEPNIVNGGSADLCALVNTDNDNVDVAGGASDGQPIGQQEDLSNSEDENEEEEEPPGNPSTSTAREKCWYGAGCYRKSSSHRAQFTHPGDDDYDSDPKDDRPTCSYGADCYRRSKDHRKQYKHPGKPADRKRKRRKPAKKTPVETSEDDDYDYDDPFLADGSEDEYEEESWSEYDSDDDSDQSEDEHTTKTLLKEAKRFAGKRK